MRIAVPVSAGRLSPHFGRCESFALIDADPDAKEILNCETLEAPPHERGAFPAALKEKGVTHVIVSGMGPRAVGLLQAYGIQVVTGALPDEPEAVVRAFMNGMLQTGESPCDHDGGHGCSHSGE